MVHHVKVCTPCALEFSSAHVLGAKKNRYGCEILKAYAIKDAPRSISSASLSPSERELTFLGPELATLAATSVLVGAVPSHVFNRQENMEDSDGAPYLPPVCSLLVPRLLQSMLDGKEEEPLDADLGRVLGPEFDVNEKLIRGWRKQRDKLFACSRRRHAFHGPITGRHDALEKELRLHKEEKSTKGLQVSCDDIQTKARELARQDGIGRSTFKASK
ncbi:hypothetical protein HPB47_014292 [Ixodes persulcatus]|uniref:Uncharacterized protein n=1 Tax=Ixodes persulcatus TaxID=34615 RepID=A0AC60QWB5_IXOPE|nr:hypothetical protein HPB47_014292 [Ixodes persulcatus]